jgi:hypothetical protein
LEPLVAYLSAPECGLFPSIDGGLRVSSTSLLNLYRVGGNTLSMITCYLDMLDSRNTHVTTVDQLIPFVDTLHKERLSCQDTLWSHWQSPSCTIWSRPRPSSLSSSDIERLFNETGCAHWSADYLTTFENQGRQYTSIDGMINDVRIAHRNTLAQVQRQRDDDRTTLISYLCSHECHLFDGTKTQLVATEHGLRALLAMAPAPSSSSNGVESIITRLKEMDRTGVRVTSFDQLRAVFAT